VKDLDAVYSVAVYHDVPGGEARHRQDEPGHLRGLKPGGIYASSTTARERAPVRRTSERYHRIDEQLVRDEVRGAGFRLLEEASFLRNLKTRATGTPTPA